MTVEDALRERIAELEAHVEWLEAEIDERLASNAALSLALKLTEAQGCLLLLLYNAKGRFVSRWFLDDHLPRLKNHERVSEAAIAIPVYHLRRRMGARIIESAYGCGYRLTEEGRRIVGEALGAS